MYSTVLFLAIAAIVSITGFRWMVAKWRAFRMRRTALDGAPLYVDSLDVDVLNPRKLLSELKDVTNWCLLGIYLGVPISELNRIEQDYRGCERQKLQMLDRWLERTPTASWGEVVYALQQIGEIRVADCICQKHIRGRMKEGGATMGIARTNKMKGKFATLLKNICKKLKKKRINSVEVNTFLISYFPEANIPKSSNMNEIFDTISHQKLWDYENYYPLEQFINGFVANDPHIKQWLKIYKKDLRSCKASAKQHLYDSSDESTSEEETS